MGGNGQGNGRKYEHETVPYYYVDVRLNQGWEYMGVLAYPNEHNHNEGRFLLRRPAGGGEDVAALKRQLAEAERVMDEVDALYGEALALLKELCGTESISFRDWKARAKAFLAKEDEGEVEVMPEEDEADWDDTAEVF